MNILHLPSHPQRKRSRLPLRLYLTLWSSGLVLALCLVLILFVNIIVARNFPHIISYALSATHHLQPSLSACPGVPLVPAKNSYVMLSEHAGADLSNNLLTNLWFISLIGLALIAILGCAGAYWFVGKALNPLRKVSNAAEYIRAHTLHTRLAFDGPGDEIKRLADAFDAMLERLEQAFESQKRFVGDVSHELRTPLALLRTNLEVAATSEHANLNKVINTQERAVNRLERLVADLLLLAKSEYVAPLEYMVSLGPLMEEALDEMKPVAERLQVSTRLESKAEVIVHSSDDGSLLKRALSNLIENAIHYNRVGGEVVVTVDQNDAWVQVTVADTGIGISPEASAHIFERFYRVDNAWARRNGGTGLGLSIVSTIVQQHGGRIHVTSTPNKGSVFTVLLPR